jgi:hypothetical protein
VLALVEDAGADLLDEERAVLAYAAETARERGLCRVALPQRTVAAATGLSQWQARLTLDRLDERRLLPLHTHGRGCIGCPANLYTRCRLSKCPKRSTRLSQRIKVNLSGA